MYQYNIEIINSELRISIDDIGTVGSVPYELQPIIIPFINIEYSDKWFKFGENNTECYFMGNNNIWMKIDKKTIILPLTLHSNNKLLNLMKCIYKCDYCHGPFDLTYDNTGIDISFEKYNSGCEHLQYNKIHSECINKMTTQYPQINGTTLCSKCLYTCKRCNKVTHINNMCNLHPSGCSTKSIVKHQHKYFSETKARNSVGLAIDVYPGEVRCKCGIIRKEWEIKNIACELCNRHNMENKCTYCHNVILNGKCSSCKKISTRDCECHTSICDKCNEYFYRCILCHKRVCYKCDDNIKHKPHSDHWGTYCSDCINYEYKLCTNCHNELLAIKCEKCNDKRIDHGWVGCRLDCKCFP